jgi:hypothetical protein
MRDYSHVAWQYVGHGTFAEPFLHDTMKAAAKKHPDRAPINTDLKILEEFARLPVLTRPSAIIFHITRCGSTLVANAMKTVENSLMLSEPQPFLKLLKPSTFDTAPYPVDDWQRIRIELLRGVLAAYVQCTGQSTKYLFIKANGWAIMFIDLLRSIWPGIPCVFIYRDPVEVMVSNLRKNATWSTLNERPLELARLFRWPPQIGPETTIEEFFARTTGKCIEEMIEKLDDKTFLLHYDDINTANLVRLLDFIGIERSEFAIDNIEKQLKLYAKDPKQRAEFEPDSAAKQSEASALVREMAERWAYPAYRRAESIRHSSSFGIAQRA